MWGSSDVTCVTGAPVRTSTPMRARAVAAWADSGAGKAASSRGPASTRTIRAFVGTYSPAIYAYFYNFIAGAAPKIKGYVPDGGGVVDLRKVTVG